MHSPVLAATTAQLAGVMSTWAAPIHCRPGECKSTRPGSASLPGWRRAVASRILLCGPSAWEWRGSRHCSGPSAMLAAMEARRPCATNGSAGRARRVGTTGSVPAGSALRGPKVSIWQRPSTAARKAGSRSAPVSSCEPQSAGPLMSVACRLRLPPFDCALNRYERAATDAGRVAPRGVRCYHLRRSRATDPAQAL